MNITTLIVSSRSFELLAADGTDEPTSFRSVLFALAVVGLTIVMLSTRRRIAQSRKESSTNVRDRHAGLSKQIGVRRDMETVMAELDKLSRQIHGRIDIKLARLEKLIRDADQRIERLSQLSESPSASHGSTVEITLHREDPHQPAFAKQNPAGENRRQAVYRLADDGLSPVEIAQRIGDTPGEIELILSLRKTRSSAMS